MSEGTVTSRRPVEASASSSAWERVADLRDRVDRALEQSLPGGGAPTSRLYDAMRHAVVSPGKRIRPLLTLLTAEHLDCPYSTAMPAACALELVHAASLALDDLPCMDNADLRRGQPSLHVRHGEDVAVLASIALLSHAFAVLAQLPQIEDAARVRMVALLARTVGVNGLVDGQAKDLRAPPDPSVIALREVHYQKTSVLFIAAVEIGAVIAGAPPTTIEALRCFAEELGLAFQVMDDLDDDDEVQAGKPGANMLSVVDERTLRQEVATRVAAAKAALRRGDPRLLPMQDYVDLLLARPATRVGHG